MQSYHFNIGNSSQKEPGIGLCARVLAETEEEAVEILSEYLGDTFEMHNTPAEIEYCNVYFHEDVIEAKAIDEVDELEDEEAVG